MYVDVLCDHEGKNELFAIKKILYIKTAMKIVHLQI